MLVFVLLNYNIWSYSLVCVCKHTYTRLCVFAGSILKINFKIRLMQGHKQKWLLVFPLKNFSAAFAFLKLIFNFPLFSPI